MFLSSHDAWPLLEKSVDLKLLASVDAALAQYLLSSWPEAPECIAVFLCHLSASVRHGHLCIQVDEREVFPVPQEIWLSPEGVLDESVNWQKIKDMIVEGAKWISDERVGKALPIRQEDILFYFQKQWMFEEIFVSSFCSLLKQEPVCFLDSSLIQQHCQILLDEKLVLPEQAEGIRKAAINSLSVICGGPGTGKTHTAGILIRTLCSLSSRPLEVALAAPTGKAAANLQKSLSKAMEGYPCEAKTLHRLLGIGGRTLPELTHKLSADVILVDESSMIDIRLMMYLFSAVKPGARLILLGDPHQLPPVETGSVFADVVQTLRNGVKDSLTILRTCLRAEKQELVFLGRAINEGNSHKVMELINQKGSCLEYFPLDKDPARFIEKAVILFEHLFEGAKTPFDFLQAFNRFRLLSPLRQGVWGVDALNKTLWNKLKFAGAVPIMLTGTNEKLNLFNGQVGILIQSEGNAADFNKGSRAYFAPHNDEEQIRCVPALLLPKYEYAYAISVYKSQGSEFDHVMLLLPPGSEVFGREVFYTAVTRAKCRLDVWCDEQTVEKTLEKHSQRLSGVCRKVARNRAFLQKD